MKNRQIDHKKTKQIRIDADLHMELKLKATQKGVSMKKLLEQYLQDLTGIR